eukprot:351233-Rhodomonas_salina.2
MALRTCYAFPGTSLESAASCLRACYAISGTSLTTTPYAHGSTVRDPIFLRSPYALSGTDLRYSRSTPRACYGMFGTELRYAPTRPLLSTLRASYKARHFPPRMPDALCLCPYDYGPTPMALRARYATPGTNAAYGATLGHRPRHYCLDSAMRPPAGTNPPIALSACYAMSGTEGLLPYACAM